MKDRAVAANRRTPLFQQLSAIPTPLIISANTKRTCSSNTAGDKGFTEVIEYFDARIIGLSYTPQPCTRKIREQLCANRSCCTQHRVVGAQKEFAQPRQVSAGGA